MQIVNAIEETKSLFCNAKKLCDRDEEESTSGSGSSISSREFNNKDFHSTYEIHFVTELTLIFIDVKR